MLGGKNRMRYVESDYYAKYQLDGKIAQNLPSRTLRHNCADLLPRRQSDSRIPMLQLLLLSLTSSATSTPSVWSCPFVNPMGPLPPMDFRMGEDCPSDSFLHYYSCCDDNPFQCCFHFETWAIVMFGVTCIVLLAVGLFFSGRLLLSVH
ncbi:unnamed protein product [Caenorhabditis auriculariae]|uniref:Uncharacterized protein n=1 Tax=Caenorhabditis auriculariae TaxID=2777116 RepID=A0A8S1GYC8_9PELO|nr:unnamed protein product [Caenorhabditis auriculariae]